MERDYVWVTGGIPHVNHIRLIASGGFSEVHEIRQAVKGETRTFARKLLRPFAGMVEEDIENEARVITALCGKQRHPNIVGVLAQGWLPGGPYYFMDMELGDLDLQQYIYQHLSGASSSFIGAFHLKENSSAFVFSGSSVLEKARNVWTIALHIADGLSYVHSQGQIHRDIKPSNILYFARQDLWKITDFGTSTSGDSDHLYTTECSRGTSSYRAPELLSEHPKFNNKVDIWALGCILYEVVCYKKLFPGDWSVLEFCIIPGAEMTMPEAPGWPRSLQSHLHKMLKTLLAVNLRLRPSASDMSRLFNSYQLLLKSSVVEVIEEVNSLPPFSHWQNIVKSSSSDRDLLLCLATLSEKNNQYDIAVRLRKSLVELYPDVQLRNQLAEVQAKIDEWESTIRVWSSLVDHNPDDIDLQNRLSLAFEERAEIGLAIGGWKELVNKHPTVKSLQQQLSKTLELYGDLDASIRTWKELAEQHLDVPVLLAHLADAYEAKGDLDAEIAAWKCLIEASPHVPWLQSRLASVYKRKLSENNQLADDELWVKAWSMVTENRSASGDIWSMVQLADSYFKDKRYTDALALYDVAITIAKVPGDAMDLRIKKSLVYQAKGAHREAIELLKQLVVSSPNDVWLHDKLSDAYQLIEDYTAESQTWSELIETNPDEMSLKFKLAEAYQRLEDFDRAISYLMMLCQEYPNNSILRDRLRQAYYAKGDPDATTIALPTNDTANDEATSDYGSIGLPLRELDEETGRSSDESKGASDFLQASASPELLLHAIDWLECLNRHPNDEQFLERLTAVYEATNNPQVAITGWAKLMDSHPKCFQFATKLAMASQSCADLTAATAGLRAVLRVHPAYLDAQEYLSAAYATQNNILGTISGWLDLVLLHPTETGLVEKLDEAYVAKDDHDLAMEGWWMVLVKHPLHLSIVKKFRDACFRKQRLSKPSMQDTLHFLWLCILSLASEISVDWGSGELDWWPLASQDELMALRPYMFQEELTHDPTGTTILAWRHRPVGSNSRGSGTQDIELNLQAVQAGANTDEGGAGGLRERRPPGNGEQANDFLPGMAFTLCHQKMLHQIKIVAKPNDKDFDKKVFGKLKEEYCKAKGTWAQIICGFSLWDLKELRVVKLEHCKTTDGNRAHVKDLLTDDDDESEWWTHFFKNPEKLEWNSTQFRDAMPLERSPVKVESVRKVCHGLHFKHHKAVGQVIVAAFAFLSLAFSVTFGVIGLLVNGDWKSVIMGVQGVISAVGLYLTWSKKR